MILQMKQKTKFWKIGPCNLQTTFLNIKFFDENISCGNRRIVERIQ